MNLEELNLVELNTQEAQEIEGGRSGWYYLAYAVGAVADAFYEAATGPAIRPSKYR